MAKATLDIGLIGLGTVGSQVAERMLLWGQQLSRRAGVELCLRRVLVRDINKRRSIEISPELLTADPAAILDDPSIDVLIEVAGGNEPMHSYLQRAIQAGKHVITANKVVMAIHGPELLDLAAEKNVDVYFEAAVGGGIPLISTFRTDLQANRIERVSAVINGTTNYVLGRMASAGISLKEAVSEAQVAGFAEADPSDDIGGFDAAYKLAILASIAYEIKVRPQEIYREGIEGVEPVDFRYARELGYAIKLVAHTQRHPGRVEARVHPAMVPLDHPLARVEGAENAVFVEGDLVGQVQLIGQGAGGRRRPCRPCSFDPARGPNPSLVQLRRPHRRDSDGRGRDPRVLPHTSRRPRRGAGRHQPRLRGRGREHLERHPEGRVGPGSHSGAGRDDPSLARLKPSADA
jgi:homoserine dehydrogenase